MEVGLEVVVVLVADKEAGGEFPMCEVTEEVERAAVQGSLTMLRLRIIAVGVGRRIICRRTVDRSRMECLKLRYRTGRRARPAQVRIRRRMGVTMW